ncbi:MAG: hypothetical protein NC244_12945 [Alistipes senegalensis]|nr:hypothetical protein [Alistipes senegalensis]
MFTNTKVITVFHKTTDVKKRLPTWEKHLLYGVYWENCSGQSEEDGGMEENNEILCIIPEKSLKNFIPCKDDFICLGDVEEKGSLTIMSVKDFRYGSGKVRHIEVTAK